MDYDKPIIQTSILYREEGSQISNTRTIFYGEVIIIDDPTDGGRIKVKILDFDNKTGNEDLPWCYPLLPKFFHVYPQIGEVVRVFIEDIKYPQRSRFWLGSVISQPQKIGFDTLFSALSTTNMALTAPEAAPGTYPDAIGVFPLKTDVAIVGKVNADIILSLNQVSIRAGKHENNDILKLNVKNPAEIIMTFEQKEKETTFYSNTLIMSDKIAILSHDGKPQFKAARITPTDRLRIFNEGHPVARGDVLVEALEIIRNAILNHMHSYPKMPAVETEIINSLKSINFEGMLQKNIVIN